MTAPLTARAATSEGRPGLARHTATRPKLVEKRAHSRVKLSLPGRLMLADRSEHECETINMSPGGAFLQTPARGDAGDHVIIYFERIGRFEGKIIRSLPNGIAVGFHTTPRRREKLSTHLIWLANQDQMGLPEDRRHERFVPENPTVNVIFPNGESYRCRFLDVSLSGASLAGIVRPRVGDVLTIGQLHGKVVRNDDEGFAVEFAAIAQPALLRTLLAEKK